VIRFYFLGEGRRGVNDDREISSRSCFKGNVCEGSKKVDLPVYFCELDLFDYHRCLVDHYLGGKEFNIFSPPGKTPD
jgi:hypothetical protein